MRTPLTPPALIPSRPSRRRLLFLLALWMIPWAGGAPVSDGARIADHPHFLVQNADWQLFVANPIAPGPYYAGQRFAHTALVAQAKWRGIPFFAEFTEGKSPTDHDHIGGTAEEFDIFGPPGFSEDAEEPQPFLKIGVGLLIPEEAHAGEGYRFWRIYRWLGRPEIIISQPADDTLVFEERLVAAAFGLGYTLRSTVALAADGGGFSITRRLTNLGDAPLRTEHYAHNFLRLDDRDIGPAYRLEWNYPLEWAAIAHEGKGLEMAPRSLGFAAPTAGVGVYLATDGEVDLGADFAFTLSLAGNGISLNFGPDRPVHRFAIWGDDGGRTLSPEAFVRIRLEPGATAEWANHYRILKPADP